MTLRVSSGPSAKAVMPGMSAPSLGAISLPLARRRGPGCLWYLVNPSEWVDRTMYNTNNVSVVDSISDSDVNALLGRCCAEALSVSAIQECPRRSCGEQLGKKINEVRTYSLCILYRPCAPRFP